MKRKREEMLRQPTETDGPCFAIIAGKECGILLDRSKDCGTYACEFYKPSGCKDWIRLEEADGILFVSPEEYRRLWP